MIYNFPFFPHFYSVPRYSYPQNNNRNVNNPLSNGNTAYKPYDRKNYNKNQDTQHGAGNFNVKSNKQERAKKKYSEKNQEEEKAFSSKEKYKRIYKEKNGFIDESSVVFEIFGIKLHYDDILLLCLIFFLYKEGVQDEFLFVALILLLIS